MPLAPLPYTFTWGNFVPSLHSAGEEEDGACPSPCTCLPMPLPPYHTHTNLGREGSALHTPLYLCCFCLQPALLVYLLPSPFPLYTLPCSLPLPLLPCAIWTPPLCLYFIFPLPLTPFALPACLAFYFVICMPAHFMCLPAFLIFLPHFGRRRSGEGGTGPLSHLTVYLFIPAMPGLPFALCPEKRPSYPTPLCPWAVETCAVYMLHTWWEEAVYSSAP